VLWGVSFTFTSGHILTSSITTGEGDIMGVLILVPPMTEAEREDLEGRKWAYGTRYLPFPYICPTPAARTDGEDWSKAEIEAEEPMPRMAGSQIVYFLNGAPLGVAYTDIFFGKSVWYHKPVVVVVLHVPPPPDFSPFPIVTECCFFFSLTRPLLSPTPSHAHTYTTGRVPLGLYYAAVSCYNGARVAVDCGPDFQGRMPVEWEGVPVRAVADLGQYGVEAEVEAEAEIEAVGHAVEAVEEVETVP
jgi:hypothetical protein